MAQTHADKTHLNQAVDFIASLTLTVRLAMKSTY